MRIDDHNEITGGHPDALTVWLSDEDINQLKDEEIIQSENKERKIKILIGINNEYANGE